MSDSPAKKILFLVVDGLSPDRLAQLKQSTQPGPGPEIFTLTEASGPAALEKIFAADSISVWGKL